MTPLAAYPLPTLDLPAVAPRDRVRVPDGRIGQVIGFYRTDQEAVLVLFGAGDSREYARVDLRRLAER